MREIKETIFGYVAGLAISLPTVLLLDYLAFPPFSCGWWGASGFILGMYFMDVYFAKKSKK